MASIAGQRALETVFSTPENVSSINEYELPKELVVENEKAWEDHQGYAVWKVSKVSKKCDYRPTKECGFAVVGIWYLSMAMVALIIRFSQHSLCRPAVSNRARLPFRKTEDNY